MDNLPCRAVVETYGVIDALDAKRLDFGELPSPIYPHVVNQEMTVEVGLRGDKELAFRAFAGDPLVAHHPRPG